MRERIAVVVADFSVGGVQRSAISIAQMLAGEHDVTIVSPSPESDLTPDASEIDILTGNQAMGRDLGARTKRLVWLARTLTDLDLTIAVALTPGPAAMTLAGLAALRNPTQVVFAERNDYRVKVDRLAVRAARMFSYRHADAVVVQTSSLAEAVLQRRRKRPVYVIPNALSRTFSSPGERLAVGEPRMLFVGRLVPQKQADQAIRAFCAIARAHPTWTLDVVGDGPCLPALKRQAAASGFSDRIHFHGLVSDPSEFYRRASVLVLTSKHEGFPNVLIEAMAFGVPVVSYDCPSGPSEILTHGRSGYLVAP
ncbi:MAG: glycosyltransferase, partial [Acidimicrobiales bacterium]